MFELKFISQWKSVLFELISWINRTRWWNRGPGCNLWSHLTPKSLFFLNSTKFHHKTLIPLFRPTSFRYQSRISCFSLPQNPLQKKYCSVTAEVRFRPVWSLIQVPSEALDAWLSPGAIVKRSQQLYNRFDLYKPVFDADTVLIIENQRFRPRFQLDLSPFELLRFLDNFWTYILNLHHELLLLWSIYLY